MFWAIFCPERKTVVYSNVVYFPNVVVGWRSRVRRCRLCRRISGPPTYYNIRTLHHIAINHSLMLLKMGERWPGTCRADSKINKIVIFASSWSLYIIHLQQWCTVKQKSNRWQCL